MPYRGFIQEAAGPAQRRLSLGLCALVLLSVLVVVPRAAMPLPQLPHISGMYGAATAMIDLATFWLLISAPRPHRSHIVIAAAYLFASLMAILHVLTFPGAVFADGPVLGSPHAVSWLFIGWRAGFAMLIAWAALVEPPDAQASPARPSSFPLVVAVLAVLALAISSQLTDAASVTIVQGRSLFSHVSVVGSYVSAAAAAMAILVIWVRGLFRRSIFTWLVFVLVAESAGVWLSTFSGQRYSLAWYMTRLEGLVANTVLLALLAMHFRSVQKRLTDAFLALERRTDELQAQVHKREAAETQLARAQKLDVVGRLGASLAHDLNNILQVLTGRLAIIQRRAGPAVESDVQVMRRSVRKAEALTRQLTLLSGRRRNQPQAIQAGVVLGEMEEVLHSLVGRRCKLKVSAEEGLPTVALDPLELEIAVTNLVTNACDASSGVDGAIHVRAFSASAADGGPALAIEVVDEGEGIKPEILEKVFEPFFTTKTRGNGTGLGLAQVHGFVTASGGTVNVRSEVGRGTAVTMVFPTTAAVGGARQTAVPTPRAVEGRVLLLVEDNPDVRESSVQLLSAEGLAVRAVDSADQALTLLEGGFAPDYLVSDIVMPGRMDGAELVRRVRDRFPAIKAVLVTGYSDVAERARDEGYPVLRKPYDLTSLMAALS